MYRRRRRAREPIAFSFDSFLDVVANVIGIIVRLILIAWVGARSYTASMQQADDAPSNAPELTAPAATDDPVHSELDRMRRDLAEARRRLLDQVNNLWIEETRSRETRQELAALEKQQAVLDGQLVQLTVAEKGATGSQAVASAAELKQRSADLLKQIRALTAAPSQKQVLRYHTPVSRAVHADEMFFECRHGRVTYIDLPAFMLDVRSRLEDDAEALKNQWSVTHTTAPVGAFRMRYVVEREKGAFDGLASVPTSSQFRFGLCEYVLEPIAAERGESMEAALKEQSDFRRLVDRLDAQITVVTFWIYPDSFELFRRLRDHLYEREIEVAGRPLIDGADIAASRNGTASRGQ